MDMIKLNISVFECVLFQDKLGVSEKEFLELMSDKLVQAMVEPGEPVGLLSAQVSTVIKGQRGPLDCTSDW